ncbi:MAG: exopolysaccharide biosynthesis polyprenyl glycosylphosphotransferase [Acidobacteriota bacterium]
MARRPHHLTSLELLRLLLEHGITVGYLFAAVVSAIVFRDEQVTPMAGLGPWLDLAAVPDRVLGAWRRFMTHHQGLLYLFTWLSLFAAIFQYGLYLHGLYDRRPVRRKRQRLRLLIQGGLLAALTIFLIDYFVRPEGIGRLAVTFGLTATVLTLFLLRTVRSALWPREGERLLLLGHSPQAAELLDETLQEQTGIVVGRVGARESGELGPPWIGDWADLPRLLVDDQAPDRLLLAEAPQASLLEPLVAARLSGIGIDTVGGFAEGVAGQVFEKAPGLEFLTEASSRSYGTTVRLAEVVLSFVGLIVSAVPMALVALAIKIGGGRGPVLFSQQRVGLAGAEFTMWKFRTMTDDAEKHGPAWASVGDRRITKLGAFLRATRLDELPQLYNILRGDMSFVGPRPEQPYFVEQLKKSLPNYSLRHLVRPGLTGWAQLKLRYASSEEDSRLKLRYDLFYIKHRSPYLDAAILFDTVRVVLRGRGR